LLQRCLDRDVRRRLRDIGEARIAIERAILDPSGVDPARSVEATRHARLAWALRWAISAAMLVLAAVLATVWAPWRAAIGVQPLRVNVALGPDVRFVNTPVSTNLALSPRGDVLAFVGKTVVGTRQLYVRRLDQWQAAPLAGTENGRDPFFSPDGRWIGFFADGKLKKIGVAGGATVVLCDTIGLSGATWADDGTIVFAQTVVGGPLLRVSDAGGVPEPLTRSVEGERFQRWPQALIGGRAVLFTSGRESPLAGGSYDVVAQQLPNGPRKVLQTSSYFARYVSGYLLYLHDRTMFAAPFDVQRLELTGKPVPVLQQVSSSPAAGSGQLAVSESGTVVYLEAADVNEGAAPLVWLDRDGQTSPLRSTRAQWGDPRFSPDGNRLAMDITPPGGRPAVWVYDWTRDLLTRLTFGDGGDVSPVWTPDGRRIVFASTRGNGIPNLYWQRADGTGDVQRLTDSRHTQIPTSFHSSGRFIAFSETLSSSGDAMILPIAGDDASGWKPRTPVVFQNAALDPVFSPDGRWIAYTTNESGRAEVVVRSFAEPGAKWPVSTSGGRRPRWSQVRHELLFADLGLHIMAASYAVEGDSLRVDKPRPWSAPQVRVRPDRQDFALHPDGNRLVFAGAPQNPAGTEPDHVNMILNFTDELRRMAPNGKR